MNIYLITALSFEHFALFNKHLGHFLIDRGRHKDRVDEVDHAIAGDFIVVSHGGISNSDNIWIKSNGYVE